MFLIRRHVRLSRHGAAHALEYRLRPRAWRAAPEDAARTGRIALPSSVESPLWFPRLRREPASQQLVVSLQHGARALALRDVRNGAPQSTCNRLTCGNVLRSTGVLWQAIKNRRMFLVASQAIRFRHAIPPFHAYEVKSQMIYWDGPWVYFLHQFQDPTTGKQFAEGLARVMLKQHGEMVSFEKLIAEIYDGSIPPQPTQPPDVVKGFLEWDAASRSSMERAQEKEETMIRESPAPAKPEKLGARIWMEMQRSMNRP
ncbi:unnamed protein product [Phytophthora lilii]|uniref:Unnamed protein product n=1 Tax=Phytophthora lilii TaxID=2077276 RepID=A0A9W6WN02_9STRA|nr:unnamed protein product [Phytophthora lilii]